MPNDRHTHVFFISGRGAEVAVVRDTPEVEWGRLPLSAQRWARYLGAAAMFHLGDSAPTQPHFLYLHAHLYLTTACRWLKSSVLQCSNSLCKIESWLWADVNHDDLACTLMLLEGAFAQNLNAVCEVPGGWLLLRWTGRHTKGWTQTED